MPTVPPQAPMDARRNTAFLNSNLSETACPGAPQGGKVRAVEV